MILDLVLAALRATVKVISHNNSAGLQPEKSTRLAEKLIDRRSSFWAIRSVGNARNPPTESILSSNQESMI
jgi:hypothetical protein